MKHAPVLTPLTPVSLNWGPQVGAYQKSVHYKSRPRFIVTTPLKQGIVTMRGKTGDPSWHYQMSVTEQPYWGVYQEGGSTPNWATSGDLYNAAYGRFVAKMNMSDSKSELGAGLIEYGKTAEFVRDKFNTLEDYVMNIDNSKRVPARKKLLAALSRKSRDQKYIDSLRRAAFRERWAIPRWLGSRWLEAWMVIAPTIGDITGSLAVLASDLPPRRVRGSAKDAYSGYKPWTWSDLRRYGPYAGTKRLAITADVRVTNPNTYLANQLGVLNPFTIAGQVTPWSWMVGWFVNWEQVLNSWTDFAGLSVSNICIVHKHEIEGKLNFSYYSSYKCSSTVWAKSYGRMPQGGLSLPTLSVTLPNKLSISRAATSISLIVNLLTNRR